MSLPDKTNDDDLLAPSPSGECAGPYRAGSEMTEHGKDCCCTLCLEYRFMLPLRQVCGYCRSFGEKMHLICASETCVCSCHAGPFSGRTASEQGPAHPPDGGGANNI